MSEDSTASGRPRPGVARLLLSLAIPLVLVGGVVLAAAWLSGGFGGDGEVSGREGANRAASKLYEDCRTGILFSPEAARQGCDARMPFEGDGVWPIVVTAGAAKACFTFDPARVGDGEQADGLPAGVERVDCAALEAQA